MEKSNKLYFRKNVMEIGFLRKNISRKIIIVKFLLYPQAESNGILKNNL